MKTNASPESFMIRDKNYSIVSCSPETLISKKGKRIITKPIAGTLKKNKFTNKYMALNFFKNNIKANLDRKIVGLLYFLLTWKETTFQEYVNLER